MRKARASAPVAIVDIGSNSGRVAVYGRDAAGQLAMLAGTRAALRLVNDVDEDRRLSDESITRTLEALHDFKAVAWGAGARRVVAIATAAMRDAENGPELIRRIRREVGIHVEVIDGDREARYGFLGAVRGLPVDHGALFDLGGGSLQVSRFQGRRLGKDWSLPLGALRLSNRFLDEDPPSSRDVARLCEHVSRKLVKAGIGPLRAGDALVGTGGTVRNLAKVDRAAREYPVRRLHGYLLGRKQVAEIARMLASRRLAQRERVSGLSDERGDSIVGGAFAILTLMDHLGAERLIVSGQGVREGLALSMLGEHVPSPAQVRNASVLSLASRFSTWRPDAALRRRAIADSLQARLDPHAREELREALAYAAVLLDVGRALDFFDRYEHVADMVEQTELLGFSHRLLALVAAVLRAARSRQGQAKGPLLDAHDRQGITRAGLLLALADDIEERCLPRGSVSLRIQLTRRTAAVTVRRLIAWRPRTIGRRFAEVFGRELIVRPGRR
jgi:exopolyphosphatase/guanosine-5'-triphosphate,3'-diphosphate pyrophosphatase